MCTYILFTFLNTFPIKLFRSSIQMCGFNGKTTTTMMLYGRRQENTHTSHRDWLLYLPLRCMAEGEAGPSD